MRIHPNAFRIISGLNYKRARKTLKEFGCTKSEQSYIIREYKRLNQMKSDTIEVKPEDKITFGKYCNKTFDEISDIDPDYILWLSENVKTIKFSESWIKSIKKSIKEQNSELRDILLEHYFDIY